MGRARAGGQGIGFVNFLTRLSRTIAFDLGAAIPGTGIPFRRENILRLVLYIGLIVFLARLAFLALEKKKPLPPLEERPLPNVTEPRNI